MEDEDFKIVNLRNTFFKVYRDGRVEKSRVLKNKKEKLALLKNISSYGYYKTQVKRKDLLLHRIVAYTYLGLDFDNPKIYIDHIDHNRKNNDWLNLRIVTPQQNNFNISNVKGYSLENGKYRPSIAVNYKTIHLGRYEKEEDARQAYIDAKKKYHKY